MYNVFSFVSLSYSILISFYYEINSFFGNIDIFKNNKLKCLFVIIRLVVLNDTLDGL